MSSLLGLTLFGGLVAGTAILFLLFFIEDCRKKVLPQRILPRPRATIRVLPFVRRP